MSPEQRDEQTPRMDAADLWREDVFTDRKIGTIRRMTPVKPDGTPDAARKQSFVGEASIMTEAGALPLNFELPAETLEQAVAAYGEAVQKAFVETMEQLKEMRRRSSSQIVIPKGGALPPPPGGGKLHLP